MDYSDLTAVTFWQVMQRHLSECHRWYEEAREWECLITRRRVKGYGSVDIEFAEGQVKSLQELGDASSSAFRMQWNRYQEFQQYVFNKLPAKFTSLPVANCDDISKIDPRTTALAIELILRELLAEPEEQGVSLRDIFVALDFAEEDISKSVKKFVDSKKIKTPAIGKTGGKNLYRLSEILIDFGNYSPLTPAEKTRLSKRLQPMVRKPEEPTKK